MVRRCNRSKGTVTYLQQWRPGNTLSEGGSVFMSKRRDFLKAVAGGVATGFPAIVPSSAFGKDGYVAPSEKIVLGAIGVGRQGSGDLRGFLSQEDVRVAAIDRKSTRLNSSHL